MIPATTTRVQENTDEAINNHIRAQTERNIEYFSRKGGAAIDQRLEELDREWDVERLLETNAASLALLGVGLGALVDRHSSCSLRWSRDFSFNMRFRGGALLSQYFVVWEFGQRARLMWNAMR